MPFDPLDKRNPSGALRAALRPLGHRGRVLGARLASLAARPRRDPIVVLGHHKAGTTAVAALLAEHLGEDVTLDMPALIDRAAETGWREDFATRYAWYFRRGVIKDPWLTPHYERLRVALPGARFVLVVRDPRANLRSVLDRLALPGDCAGNPAGLDRLPTGWRALLSGAVEGQTHYIEGLAERWQAAATADAAGDQLICLRYEDFNRDKEGTIAALAERLGRPGAIDISVSVDRAYQPAGRSRDVDWHAFYGSDNLQRLERICRAGMHRFGYPPLMTKE